MAQMHNHRQRSQKIKLSNDLQFYFDEETCLPLSVRQMKVKRLLAHSSIGHVRYKRRKHKKQTQDNKFISQWEARFYIPFLLRRIQLKNSTT